MPPLLPLLRGGAAGAPGPPLPGRGSRTGYWSLHFWCRTVRLGLSAPRSAARLPVPCHARTAARGSWSPQPSGRRLPAGRCCPSKPCSNGPRSRSWPQQIRQHRGPERGALSCLWAPAPRSPVGSHRPAAPRHRGSALGSAYIPSAVPVSWDPFPMSHILHCIHISLPAIPQTWLFWVPLLRAGVHLAAWGTLGLLGALMPLCLTLGCSWSGGSHRLHHGSLALLPVGVGVQLGWAPCVGVWVGWAPQVPVAPVSESGWDGCPVSQCPWCGVGVPQGAGVTPVSWQLGHGRQCVLDVGDQREPEPP